MGKFWTPIVLCALVILVYSIEVITLAASLIMTELEITVVMMEYFSRVFPPMIISLTLLFQKPKRYATWWTILVLMLLGFHILSLNFSSIYYYINIALYLILLFIFARGNNG